MKQTLVVTCILGSCSSLFFDADLDIKWREFKIEYQKQYDDPVENIQRRIVWEKMVHFINKHNEEAAQGLHSYTLGQNRFTDMTSEEFNAHMNGFNASLHLSKDLCDLYMPPKDVKPQTLNVTVDWRTMGYVTEIKDQGLCGSCYAFSATGSLEGQHYKATGNLVSLSERNILDCSRKQGNRGCEGGFISGSFEYIIDNGGIDTEASYPYDQPTTKCSFKREDIGATMSACRRVQQGVEEDLQFAVALEGPVSVAVDASQRGFLYYKSGVYDDPSCTTNLNHAVLVVGYDTENGKQYWLVKNSWGKNWGDDGYIKLARNKNLCGIAENALFPVV